uniref:BTB domain-containing protein n=1 Tax=Oncorhynchus mykiss TaxID=8022 RepID=A0A8C7NCU6_ONCMY
GLALSQYLPRHGQTMLDKLNQQRLNNQFCDITLLIEGEEHRAHKAVLAACIIKRLDDVSLSIIHHHHHLTEVVWSEE